MPIDFSGNKLTVSGVTSYGNYTHRVVRQGLVLYLDAGNTNSISSTWNDMSGYGNNVLWNNPPQWNSGGYYSFNGTSNYGTITSSFNFRSEQTIIIIFRKTSVINRVNLWDQHYGGYGTWTLETQNHINMFFGPNGANTSPYVNSRADPVSLNQWGFAANARNVTHQTSYNNGKRSVSFGASNVVLNPYGVLGPDTGNVRIGYGYTVNYYQGDVAVIMAYDRCLHPYEIAENFQAFRLRFGL